VSTATARSYAREAMTLLAVGAPKLRGALSPARKARHGFVVIDGALIPSTASPTAEHPAWAANPVPRRWNAVAPRPVPGLPRHPLNLSPARDERPTADSGVAEAYRAIGAESDALTAI